MTEIDMTDFVKHLVDYLQQRKSIVISYDVGVEPLTVKRKSVVAENLPELFGRKLHAGRDRPVCGKMKVIFYSFSNFFTAVWREAESSGFHLS